MINLVFLILLISSLLVFIFAKFPEEDFSIFVNFGQYEIETSLAFSFSLLLIFSIIFIFLIQFCNYLLSARTHNMQSNMIKKHNRSEQLLANYLKNLYLGDIKSSKKNISLLKKLINNKSYLYRFLNLQQLIAIGDHKKVVSYLLDMHHDYPSDIFILNSLGLEFHKQKEYSKSIQYIEKSSKITKLSPTTIDIMISNYFICGEFKKLEKLINNSIRSKIINAKEYIDKKALNYLAIARNYYQQNDMSNYYKYSKLAYDSDPNHQYVFNNFIKSLLVKKRYSKIINLITNNWEQLAHPKLTSYFQQALSNKNLKTKVSAARELIKNNPFNIESFLNFAYIAKDNSDYHEEVIKYLEKALNFAKTEDIVEILLEIKSKYYPDTDNEIIRLKKLKDNIPIEYKFICSSCNHYHQHWQLICGNCKSFDTVELRLDNKTKISLLDHF